MSAQRRVPRSHDTKGIEGFSTPEAQELTPAFFSCIRVRKWWIEDVSSQQLGKKVSPSCSYLVRVTLTFRLQRSLPFLKGISCICLWLECAEEPMRLLLSKRLGWPLGCLASSGSWLYPWTCNSQKSWIQANREMRDSGYCYAIDLLPKFQSVAGFTQDLHVDKAISVGIFRDLAIDMSISLYWANR